MDVLIEALGLSRRSTGIGTSIENLLTGLSRQSGTTERFTVYAPEYEGVRELVRPAGSKMVTVKSAATRLGRVAWRQWGLNRAAGREGAQLLHGTAYVLPPSPSVPAVVTVHDVLAVTYPEFVPTLNAMHFRRLLARSVRTAKKVIASSRYTADEIVRTMEVSARKIEVVPVGISDRFFEPVTEDTRRLVRERHGLPERYVLFVGNLEPKKNVGRLAEAMERVWEKHPEVKLVLVGPGGWKNRKLLKRIEELERRGRVQRVGYVRPEDLPAVYAASTMLALVSLAEGFGMPVVEAMASGTAVLASDAPGLREAAGEAALVAPAQDVEAMARGIERVLTETGLRAELVEKGRRHARKFRVEEYGRRHLEVYRGALSA